MTWFRQLARAATWPFRTAWDFVSGFPPADVPPGVARAMYGYPEDPGLSEVIAIVTKYERLRAAALAVIDEQALHPSTLNDDDCAEERQFKVMRDLWRAAQ